MTDEQIEVIAMNLQEWMESLKGPFAVHQDSFLPSNVTCDYEGHRHFINGMKKIIKRETT